MTHLEEVIVNATEIIPTPLEPVVQLVQKFFAITSTLLGGLFGLYLIFMVVRFIQDRKIIKKLDNIKNEIKEIRAKLERKKR